MARCFGTSPSSRVLISGVAIAAGAAIAFADLASAQARLSPPAPVLRQIAALQHEKEQRSPAQRKMSSHLVLELRRQAHDPLFAAVPHLRRPSFVERQGRVEVDVKATVTPALRAAVAKLGGEVVNSFPEMGRMRVEIPWGRIEALAGKSEVQSVREAIPPMLNKVNTSEGDVAHAADVARAVHAVDGAGVKVGVLSDSVDMLSSLETSGDLPAVTVISGQSGNPGSSEGTAMLEIVHDLAPGAQLYFATAFGGQAQFAANIQALANAGCKIIVDDVFYFAEPVLQDGIVADKVNAVAGSGVLYFSSAGNSGNKSDGTSGVWEGDFNPLTDLGAAGKSNDFGGGFDLNGITVDSPSYFTLQWSDPQGASGNDYDLYEYDLTYGVIDQSADVQNGNDDPFEIIDSTGYNDAGEYLLVVKYSGSKRFLHLSANRGRLGLNTIGETSGHGSADGAFGVAAVDVLTASGGAFTGGAGNPVETFSSDGPRRVFYRANGTAYTPGNFLSSGGVLRSKPDLAAADDVSTATPGMNPFRGTSAAAPHAAAIAAVLLSDQPELTSGQFRSLVGATSLDIEAAGRDRNAGVGIAMADRLLDKVIFVSGFDLDGVCTWSLASPATCP